MEGNLQKLRIENGNLILDDFKIKNLIGYELSKGSAESPTELSITLLIEDIRSVD